MIDSRILICQGNIAKTPYYIEKVYVNVYTIEELCYVLHENAFMIDKDILDINLVKWIDTECNLSSLARDLYPMINQNAMVSTFVGKILEYVGYYTKEDIEKTESILKLNVSMSVFEKWKAKADFLYENRHYSLALKEYERLLEKIADDDYELRSKALNNMGVTYMALNLYMAAQECFMSAYELDNNEVAYRHYLQAKRLELSDEEYIALIADDEEAYRASLPIETELKLAEEEFKETKEALNIEGIIKLKNEGSSTDFYNQIALETERLKRDYRTELLDEDGV